MALTAYERETVVNLNDEDDFAIITTYQRSVITSLRKNPAAREITPGAMKKWGGAQFAIPAKLINFRNPRRGTAAQQDPEAAAERMAKARAAKGTK
jgi:hypothetical protein